MGAVQYAAAVLADSPRAYWKLQEASGLPQDSSPNGNHMTTTSGTPDYQQSGPMSDFGIQYVNAELHFRNPVLTVTDNLAIEMWIQLLAVGANDQQFFQNGNAGTDGYGILVDSNSTFQGICNGVAFLSNSVGTLTNAWKHLVVVRRAGTWEYYLNGSVDTANAGTNAPGSPGGSTQIGNATNATTVIAHVAVYDTALSGTRISAHYQAALAVDSVVGQYVTTMTGKGNAW